MPSLDAPTRALSVFAVLLASLVALTLGSVARADDAPEIPIADPTADMLPILAGASGPVADPNSMEATAAREQSRTAFRDLDRDESLALAEEFFPQFLRAPLYSGKGGEENTFVRALGTRSAVVRTPDGDESVLRSTLPVTTSGSGDGEPVDLSLEREGGDYAPEASRTETELGDHASEGVELPSADVTVTPDVDADRQATATDEERLFYPSIAEDTDYILTPKPTGAQAVWILRSDRSPEDLPLDVDVPAGAHLRKTPVGDTGFHTVDVVDQDDKVLTVIQQPFAVDAEGRNVPVEARILGDSVSFHVDHQAGDFARPIAVDPDIGVPSTNNTNSWPGWTLTRPNVPQGATNYYGWAANPSGSNYMYMSMPVGTSYTYNGGGGASYAFKAPPDTYIARATLGNANYQPYRPSNLPYSYYTEGMSKADGNWQTNQMWVDQYGNQGGNGYGYYQSREGALAGRYADWCAAPGVPNCGTATPGPEIERNTFSLSYLGYSYYYACCGYTFGFSANASNGVTAEWAQVWLNDRHRPSIQDVRRGTNTEVWPAGVSNGVNDAWFDDGNAEQTYGFVPYDAGLGVKDAALTGSTNGVAHANWSSPGSVDRG